MLQQSKITKFQITKDFEGRPLVDRNNKTYWRIGCQFDGKEQWYGKLSYSDKDQCREWKEGMTVTVITYQNDKYFNFKQPSSNDLAKEVIQLKALFMTFVQRLDALTGKSVEPAVSEPVDEARIDPEDLPF